MANILIIDDDLVFAEMIEQRLIRAGHQASVHLGPFGGTIAARRAGLDLIILDVFMPGLDGASLLDLMRRDGTLQRRRVIFCSSMDAELLRSLAVRHQADGWIPKGAGRQQLLNYVEQVLQRSNTAETRHRPKV
jgi:DNA-binding response OmpR family regulator